MLPHVVSMAAELISNQVNSSPKPEPEFMSFPGTDVVSDDANIDWEYIHANTAYPNGIDVSPIGISTTPYDTLVMIVGDDPKVVSMPPQDETLINTLKRKIQRDKVNDAYHDIENDMSKLEKQTIPLLTKKFESSGKVEDYDALMKCRSEYIQLQYAKETTAAARMLFIMSYGYDPVLLEGQESYHEIDTTAPYITYKNFEYPEFKDAIWEEGKRYNVIRKNGHIVTYECALWESLKVFNRVTEK